MPVFDVFELKCNVAGLPVISPSEALRPAVAAAPEVIFHLYFVAVPLKVTSPVCVSWHTTAVGALVIVTVGFGFTVIVQLRAVPSHDVFDAILGVTVTTAYIGVLPVLTAAPNVIVLLVPVDCAEVKPTAA
jgi:hypothetical protein